MLHLLVPVRQDDPRDAPCDRDEEKPNRQIRQHQAAQEQQHEGGGDGKIEIRISNYIAMLDFGRNAPTPDRTLFEDDMPFLRRHFVSASHDLFDSRRRYGSKFCGH